MSARFTLGRKVLTFAGAVLFTAATVLVLQRWAAVGALQRATGNEEGHIRFNLLLDSEPPSAMPEFALRATRRVLDWRYWQRPDGRKNLAEQKVKGLFMGRIHTLYVDTHRGFDGRLSEAIVRFPHVETLAVSQPRYSWYRYDWDESIDPKSVGWLEPRDVEKLLATLPHLKRLRLLQLEGEWVGDAEVRQLTAVRSLEGLCLTDCPITAESFETFLALPNLKELDISQTWITDDESNRLSLLLPKVIIHHDGPAYKSPDPLGSWVN